MTPPIAGVMPILQTPFDDDGAIDHAALSRLVRWTIEAGAAGVVYPANASEFFSLADGERLEAAETVAAAANGATSLVVCVSGTSSEHARLFARHAAALAPDAVMALPPYTRRAAPRELERYYRTIADDAGRPVILQNLDPPLGTPIDAAALERLLDAAPAIRYVKEERMPTTHRVSQLVARFAGRLDGVLGGANGQWLVQETERGACGCMPASALTDVHAGIQRALDRGDLAAARGLQERAAPLLSYMSLYGVASVKELLAQRGVLPNAATRDPQAAVLDDADRREIARLAEPVLSPTSALAT